MWRERANIWESYSSIYLLMGKNKPQVWKRPQKHLQSNLQRGDLNLDPGAQWMPLDESMPGLWRWSGCWLKKTGLDVAMQRVFQPEETVCWKPPGNGATTLWSPYFVGAKWSFQTYSHAPRARGGQQLLRKCELGDWADQRASRPWHHLYF